MSESIINMSKKHKEQYFDVLMKEEAIFKELTNKDLFILAASIGFINDESSEFDGKQAQLIRVSYLKEKDHAILSSIAIQSTNNMEILLDRIKILKIAEGFANSGIEMIFNQFYHQDVHYEKYIETKINETIMKMHGK